MVLVSGFDIVERKDDHEAKQIDKDIKNSWCWAWMEREVQTLEVGNISLKDHIRKKRESGTAVCLLCKCDIVYKSRGWKSI